MHSYIALIHYYNQWVLDTVRLHAGSACAHMTLAGVPLIDLRCLPRPLPPLRLHRRPRLRPWRYIMVIIRYDHVY